MSGSTSLQDRARGVLVGLAVGDALGAPVEFESPSQVAGRRAELREMPGGGPFGWAPGEFTDDTQMALVLARHLRARGGRIDQATLAREFAAWAKDAVDVGNQTSTVLRAIQGGAAWTMAIRGLSPRSAPNGSLMRVAPVALPALSVDEATALASQQSEITHPNEDCIDACRVFARAIWVAIDTGVRPAIEEIGTWAATVSVRDAVLEARKTTAPEMSGWVLHTLTGALWAVCGTDSFEESVWRAVELGKDADTVGAVAGAFAGAVWGFTAIPSEFADRLQSRHPMFRDIYPTALVGLADELLGARGGVA